MEHGSQIYYKLHLVYTVPGCVSSLQYIQHGFFEIQVLPCHKHSQTVAVWRNKNQISNMWLAGYHFRSTELTPLKTTHVLPRYSHLKCWPSPFPRRPTPRLPAKVCDVARRLSFCQWFGRSCLLQNVVHVLLAMFNLKTHGSESL